MLNILSWNIRQGGGTRVSKIIKALIQLKAQVIVLSEFKNNKNGHLIRSKLITAGYIHQLVGNDLEGRNTVLIASNLPFIGSHCFKADKHFKHSVLVAEFEVFKLYGMYLPHKKKHKLFEYLLEEVQQGKPSILVGDFNTGKNFIDQKSNSFMYSDYLIKLEELGLVDAFRQLNGAVKEYSWYSHQGNGYRYDHIYIHEDLVGIVSDCKYLHDWRENKLSDHSPMLISLA